MNRMGDILTEKTILLQDVMNPQNPKLNSDLPIGGRSTLTRIMSRQGSRRCRRGTIRLRRRTRERTGPIVRDGPGEERHIQQRLHQQT